MSRHDRATDRARLTFAATPRIVLALALLAIPACSGPSTPQRVRLGPPERFGWVAQPIEFSAPPEPWERELYRGLSLLRVQIDDPLTPGEADAAAGLNAAVNRAESDVAGGHASFVKGDLEDALRAVDGYRPTLAELLPCLRLRPERMNEPARWILGSSHDTTLAGLPAFAGDDTLDAPEQRLLYRQVFWVVNGCAFQAIYQGRPESQHVFEQVLASVRFPEAGARASR